MTPSWLESHAPYIDRFRSSTTGQRIFNVGLSDNAALLKVHIIPTDVLEDSSLATLEIEFYMDESIGEIKTAIQGMACLTVSALLTSRR